MDVVLASPRGFCAGVEMAVNALSLALEKLGSPIYVYHEIVHNRTIVERFQKLGAIFVDSLESIPEGSYLMFSAHGVSPTVRRDAEARKLVSFDATCPLVTKVHLEVLRFKKLGYRILLIGHGGHDEVVGTMGHAPTEIILVEDEAAARSLEIDDRTQLAYVTQTTLSVDETSRILSILRERFPNIIGPPRADICYATQNRQDALRSLAQDCEAVVVVGSRNSSNSRRLYDIALELNKQAMLVDTADQINPSFFAGMKKVLLTAGASAPEDVVQDCLARLKRLGAQTVTESTTVVEQTHFAVPRDLARLLQQGV